MKRLIIAAAILTGLLTTDTVVAQRHTFKAGHRQRHQQHRIVGGARSGELTPAETRSLERQQARIGRNKRVARADGVVTPAERRRLDHQQNAASRNIYRKKHNRAHY